MAGLNGTEHDDISRIEVHKSALAGENPDWVVARAVTCEPVSTPKFPVNREKNREFCRIRPLSAIVKADTRANSEVFGGILIKNNTAFRRHPQMHLLADVKLMKFW